MTLMKRTPRTEMVWPSWFANGPLADWASWPVFTGESEMKVEEFMEGDHLVVRAELPGIDPDRDVEITVTDRTLTVRAERRREERKEESDGYRSEFSYGSFTRTMTLPTGATEDDITATYHDGILEVKVPIVAAAEAHKVVVARS